MTRTLYTLALIAALVTASQAAFSQAPPPPTAGADTRPPGMITTSGIPTPSPLTALRLISLQSYPMLEARLNLTDPQKQSIQDLLKSEEEKMKPLIKGQREAGKAFVDALVDGTDDAKAATLGQAAMKTEGAILAAKLKMLSGFRTILDNDQKKILSSIIERTTIMWRVDPSAQSDPPPFSGKPAAGDIPPPAPK